MKRCKWSALLAILLMLSTSRVQAIETFILGDGFGVNGIASSGNGNFEANSGTLSFADVTNWHNISGDDSAVNFGTSSGMVGSPEPSSQGAFLTDAKAGNDFGYTILAGDVGVPFNARLALHRFGGGYSGSEFVEVSLFTSTTGVDPNTVAGDLTTLGSVNIPITGSWVREERLNFYSPSLADVGKTVYLGIDLEDPNGVGSIFPRIDVVRLSKGAADSFGLQFNAALNPVNGTGLWEPNIDTAAGGAFFPTEFFTFGSTTSSVAVNDPSVPGITASYDVGAQGRQFFDPNTGSNANAPGYQGGFDASFEVWFKPDDLAGGDQIILEMGGSGNGSYFSLEDDVLSFYSRSGGVNGPTLQTTLTTAEWTQVVGTWEGSTETLQLFVNGQFVTSAVAAGDLVEWAGGNAWGVGQIGSSDNLTGLDDIATGGPLGSETSANDFVFDGEIAIIELYDKVLSASEVTDAYNAVTGIAGDFDNSGVVDGLDFLLWQTDTSIGDLADWEANYGTGGLSAAGTAVPEPSALALLIPLLCGAALRRTRVSA